MAIAAIYIVILACISLLYLGFWRRDYWIVSFGGFFSIMIGLFILNNGLEDITAFTYKFPIAILFIFIGAYFSVRSMIELIKEGGEND